MSETHARKEEVAMSETVKAQELKSRVAAAKAERELEKKLRGGWGEASTLSQLQPINCGKRIKPLPRLDEIDKWN